MIDRLVTIAGKFSKWQLFILLSIYYIAFSYVWQSVLFTDTIYYNSFSEQVSLDRIERYITIQRKLWWTTVIVLPIMLIIKSCLIAFALNVGTLFAGCKVQFGKLLKVVLAAEVIFLISTLVKGIWLYFFVDYHTIHDIKTFSPLSLLNLCSDVPVWLTYPLQTVNVFEILYWLTLAVGIQRLVKSTYAKALEIVVLSYGTGLLIWIAIIMFLSVNFS